MEITTPHDAVLAQGDKHNAINKTTNTWAPSNLFDPFDATVIGQSGSLAPDSHHNHNTVTNDIFTQKRGDGNKEEQWIHLSRVLALQNEVAKMHLDMEGVGLGDAKGKGIASSRGRGRGKTEATKREWHEGVRDGASKRSMTMDHVADATHEGDEEGVGAAGDEEIDIKKAREEKFANLANQFEGRTESIQEIMNKLDQLSKALTEFHTLKAPTFELAKRGSVTPDGTSPQSQTKSPQYTSATPPTSGIASLRPVLPPTHSPQILASSSTINPGDLESSVIPSSLSRSAGRKKTKVTPLVLNALEPGKQTHVVDSPDSMGVHVNLPPE